MSKLLQKYEYVVLGIILFFALFFRLYQLGTIPAGLINDEADTGYDAHAVLLTGHDQWNNFLPVVSMRGFGDYRPALYTYLVVGSERVFGLTPFAVRFPSALFGFLSVGVIYVIGRKLFNRSTGIVSAVLLTISPWAIGMSRVGIESNVAIFFTLCGIAAFLHAKKRSWALFLGVVGFLLAFYTYAAYTLFIPLAFLVIFIFWRKILPLTKKTVSIAIVIGILALLPFVVSRSAANTRISQVGFIHSEDIIGLTSVLNDEIGFCWTGFPTLLCKLSFNKPILVSSVYIKNYISHFSPEFLYTTGTPTQFGILPVRGLEYLIEILGFVYGIYSIGKGKKREGIFLLTLFLLAPLPDALTGAGHYSRATIMLPFLILIEAVGFVYFFSLLKRKIMLQKILTVLVVGIFLYSIYTFWVTYLTYFKIEYAMYSQYGYQQLVQNINTQKSVYDEIVVSSHLNDTKQYIYYLFFNVYNPTSFQKKTQVLYTQAPDGWMSINRIGTVVFTSSIPMKQQVLQEKRHILYISNPVDFPSIVASVFVVKDLKGNTIFEAVDSKTLQQYYATHSKI